MGRKKKKVIKPWCWYCNREFEDEKTLMQHQKAKHFKCHVCHKKLYTGPGLAIHCMQVHKETIEKIPNALPTRDSTEIEIYGMEGVPEEDILAWASRKGDPDEPDAKQARLAADMLKAQAAMMPGMIPPPGMPPAGWVPPPMPGYPGMPMPPNMPMPPGPGGYGMPPMMPMGMPPMSGAPPMPMMGGPPSMGMNGMGGPPGMPPVSAPLAPTVGGGPGSVVATFPAYNAKTSSPAMGTENMAATPGSTKIMHPDEDISLEERRAQMPQYQLTKTPIADTLSLLPDGGSGIHSGAVFANVMLGAGGGGYNKGPPIPPYGGEPPGPPHSQ